MEVLPTFSILHAVHHKQQRGTTTHVAMLVSRLSMVISSVPGPLRFLPLKLSFCVFGPQAHV